MGSNHSKPALADLDIYFCGISRNSTEYRMLKSIFTNENSSFNDRIKVNKSKERYYLNNEYSYEYRYLKNTIKNIKNEAEKNIIFNSFIFPDIKVDESFSTVLSFSLYEFDRDNRRKNVIISFGNETIVKNAIEALYDKSSNSLPVLIFVDDLKEYNEKLDYINYIPSLNKIKKKLSENPEKNFTKKELHTIAKNIFITYLKTKLSRIYAYYNEIGYNLNFINPLNEINTKIEIHATIALVGESGCGKSSFLNFVFNELVSRVSTSAIDVTTKCTEYYLPVKVIENSGNTKIGQLRFLDFPGLKKEGNYDYVEKEIKRKIEEYKKNIEQIDIALFYISNGQSRDLNDSFIKLINLLQKNNIKIIFIINGLIRETDLQEKMKCLKNSINNDEILNETFNNVINCDYKLSFNIIRRDGISNVFTKINDIIQKNVINYNTDIINISNYQDELETLSKNNRIFQNYPNFEILRNNMKIKSTALVSFYSLSSFASSAIAIFVPVADTLLGVGFQTAMVFHLLHFYDEDTNNYNKLQIVLSNGKIINFINNQNSENEENTNQNIQNNSTDITKTALKVTKEVVTKAVKTVAKDTTKEVTFQVTKEVAKEATKEVTFQVTKEVAKEATKEAAIQVTREVAKEATKEAAIQVAKEVAKEATKEVSVQVTKGIAIEAAKEVSIQSTKQVVKEMAIETSKQILQQSAKEVGKEVVKETGLELTTLGIKEAAKQVTKETALEGVKIATKEGVEEIVEVTTKETIKQVSETVVVKQGGKVWLVNLGKAVPFIGAVFSGIINTYNTASTGHRMINYLEKNCLTNKQKRVNILKSKILAVQNISEQIDKIIEEQGNEKNLNKLLI